MFRPRNVAVATGIFGIDILSSRRAAVRAQPGYMSTDGGRTETVLWSAAVLASAKPVRDEGAETEANQDKSRMSCMPRTNTAHSHCAVPDVVLASFAAPAEPVAGVALHFARLGDGL